MGKDINSDINQAFDNLSSGIREATQHKINEIAYTVLNGVTNIDCPKQWYGAIQEKVDQVKVMVSDPESTWAGLQDPNKPSDPAQRKVFDYACQIYLDPQKKAEIFQQIPPSWQQGVLDIQQRIISLPPSPSPRST